MSMGFQIFKHEIKKILTDKKLLLSMFLMPIILIFLMSFISAATDTNIETDVPKIYVLNNTSIQGIKEFKMIPVNYASIEELQNNMELDSSAVVLDIKEDNATIYYSEVNVSSYNLAIACEQLLYSNVAYKYVNIVNMLNISTVDLNDSMNMKNVFVATMLPYMLVLLLFQNTANFAVDTIAGEKERGVFGKTLLAPVKPMPVISGKILSSTVCGLISCIFYFVVVYFAESITGQDTFGIKEADLTGSMIVAIFLTAVILCYFVATLVVLYSLRAKTVKDAQNSNKIVFILVTVAAMMSMFRSGVLPYSHYFIPVYNICIIIQDVLYSAIDIGKLLIMIGSLLGCSLIVSGLTVLVFKKEAVNY